jgi:hypothetical protein
MKKAILFIAPVLVLLLAGSCSEALHRDIPKAKGHYQRRELTSFKEQPVPEIRSAEAAAVPEASDDHKEPVIVPENREALLRPEMPLQETPGPGWQAKPGVTVAREQVVVEIPQRSGDWLIQDDSITGEDTIDEAILDEALESERVARQAYHFSFLPIFTLLFFPMLIVGLIGTLSKLARFRKYEYVTEKGLDYERRAKRTLIASIFIPLVVVVLFVLLVLMVL